MRLSIIRIHLQNNIQIINSRQIKFHFAIYYCPGKTNSWNTCIKGNTEGWGLKMYYDHADETANAGKIICHSGGGKRGNRVCNSWGS